MDQNRPNRPDEPRRRAAGPARAAGRTPRCALVMLALGFAMAVGAALPGAASANWVINGRGFGHGVGLSQYGALGFAQQGRNAGRIVRHYYNNSKVERRKGRPVRVLLASGRSDVSFGGARAACGRNVNAGRTYRLQVRNGRISLRNAAGRGIRACGQNARVRARGAGVRIGGIGRYRGDLVGRMDGGSMLVINRVGAEGYIRGVIAREVPSSWPQATLRAQAIAARSYGIATRRSGPFDHYADVRSQVYGGRAAETRATNRAVKATAGRVLTHGGSVLPAYFFSTSGGRTENSEFGFAGGSPRPYLKAVDDPHDNVSPVHRWTVRLTHAQMSQRLSGLYRGNLRRIEVVRTGRSGRIVTARVVGSQGSSTVAGPTLRTRLGTRSAWMRFNRR